MSDIPAENSRKPVRVLIIDDDELVRQTLETALKQSGFTVFTAADGRLGLGALKRDPVDVVFTDIYMPEKEGIETIVEMRRDHPGVKIVAMSGGGDVGSMPVLQLAEMVGADKILTKPFTPSDMERAIDALLNPAE